MLRSAKVRTLFCRPCYRRPTTQNASASPKATGLSLRNCTAQKSKPFPGLANSLNICTTLEAKYYSPVHPASREVDHYVELLGIREFLTDTVTGDDVQNSKPAVDIFACALARVSPLRPSEIVAVGDTPYDVSAAAKCRIDTIAVTSGGFSADELQDAGAVAIYRSVLELLQGLRLPRSCALEGRCACAAERRAWQNPGASERD